MSTKRMGLGPALMTALSVVVLVQSAALTWMIFHAPDKQEILADLRSRPIETVVALCVPVKGQPGLPGAG